MPQSEVSEACGIGGANFRCQQIPVLLFLQIFPLKCKLAQMIGYQAFIIEKTIVQEK